MLAFDLPEILLSRKAQFQDAARRESIGLYLHLPFCKDRCTYCSFVTTRDTNLQSATVAKLASDLRSWGEALHQPRVDTLYFGGGTPSLMSGEELSLLTHTLMENFDLTPLSEATLEANPGTVDLAWLQHARALGWDRISLGTQTLDDELLRKLGRIHDGKEALHALELADQAGFQRRSADLMVGIPGQALKRVLEDARRLIDTGIEHMSIYLLDLDKQCELKKEIDAGRLILPSEDEVADAFEALQAELPRLGLRPYEISNYAKPNAESQHNLRYWQRRPYLGVGPSAASQLGDFRWTESGVIPAWLEGRGELEFQELSPEEQLSEIPLLGLRLHQGVDWEALRKNAKAQNLLPLVDAWESQLAPFEKFLLREGTRIRLSERGMLMSNPILQLFV
jgi:oxygen-independent coproporphyrinogen III oxidase